jgi:hypothetical protein
MKQREARKTWPLSETPHFPNLAQVSCISHKHGIGGLAIIKRDHFILSGSTPALTKGFRYDEYPGRYSTAVFSRTTKQW